MNPNSAKHSHTAAASNDPYATPTHRYIDLLLIVISLLAFAALFLHR